MSTIPDSRDFLRSSTRAFTLAAKLFLPPERANDSSDDCVPVSLKDRRHQKKHDRKPEDHNHHFFLILFGNLLPKVFVITHKARVQDRLIFSGSGLLKLWTNFIRKEDIDKLKHAIPCLHWSLAIRFTT
jgi:hypothetical protein